MLLPALNQARARSYATGCINNEKQIMLAVALYSDANDEWLVPSKAANGILAHNILSPTSGGAPYGLSGGLSNKSVFACPAETRRCGLTNTKGGMSYGHYLWNIWVHGSKGTNSDRNRMYKRNKFKYPSQVVSLVDSAHPNGYAISYNYEASFRHGANGDSRGRIKNDGTDLSSLPPPYRGVTNAGIIDGHAEGITCERVIMRNPTHWGWSALVQQNDAQSYIAGPYTSLSYIVL